MTSGAAVAVLTAMWAEVYRVDHPGAIRALGASLSMVSSAIRPAAIGWLIGDGVSMEAITFGCAAWLACAIVGIGAALRAQAQVRSRRA